MKIALIILGVLVLAFIILMYRLQAKMKKTPMVADHKEILTLTPKNFQQQIKGKTVLIDFWAAWCGPCRMMAPVLNEVTAELTGNERVGKVDIEQHQSLAVKYNVRSIPTMILFKNGVEADRFVGIKTKGFLLKQIRNA
ncbi:thioredoxin [Proteiniphilum sp.]|uniref:thioredoxin n=1 Tax=Proteiniphilum sp. TaxID=1926877 RepID=UPI002B1EC2DE|nr:thioredoxin [Proteiniphilum sp.]MEA4917223.1 thioredoxin [Proteiniphilum sp.]